MNERRKHSYSREKKLGLADASLPAESTVSVEPAPIRPRPKDECAHRGELLRTAPCESCSGEVQVKIRGCAVHGECTLSVKDVGVQRCRDCSDFRPAIPSDRESP